MKIRSKTNFEHGWSFTLRPGLGILTGILGMLLMAGVAFAKGVPVATGPDLVYSLEDLDPLPPPPEVGNVDHALTDLFAKAVARNPWLGVLMTLNPKETQKMMEKVKKLDRQWQMLDPRLRADIVAIIQKKARLDLLAGLRLLQVVKGGPKVAARLESALGQFENLREMARREGDRGQEGRYAFFIARARELLARAQSEPNKKKALLKAAREEYQAARVRLSEKADRTGSVSADDALERGNILDQPFGGILPLQNPDNRGVYLTSDLGMRMHPIKHVWLYHKGVDLANAGCNGWTVRAFGPGRVVYSGWERGYGNVVVVTHEVDGRTLFTRYGHLRQEKRPNAGTVVSRGDPIGLCNCSGAAKGSHLHFEVRENDAFGPVLDPKEWLPGFEKNSEGRN